MLKPWDPHVPAVGGLCKSHAIDCSPRRGISAHTCLQKTATGDGQLEGLCMNTEPRPGRKVLMSRTHKGKFSKWGHKRPLSTFTWRFVRPSDEFWKSVNHHHHVSWTLNTSHQYSSPFHLFLRAGKQATDSGKTCTMACRLSFLKSRGKFGCPQSPMDTYILICCNDRVCKAHFTQVSYMNQEPVPSACSLCWQTLC